MVGRNWEGVWNMWWCDAAKRPFVGGFGFSVLLSVSAGGEFFLPFFDATLGGALLLSV